jgi:thiol:disulfide interchange protein DsbC
MFPMPALYLAVIAALACLWWQPAQAQEAQIRKALAERLPQLKIDEISRSPVAGLWEVRHDGAELIYSDATGDFIIINGAIIDTKTRTDLTEQRIEKLLALTWDKLPLKDAMVFKQGNGSRKMAVFADPNCGYCKRFERDIAGIKDVTIYTFLLPILGPDSTVKSRDIWCAKDPAKAWREWMLDGDVPARAMAACDTKALDRNTAFARANRINATPAAVFEDGTRKPGALPVAMVERLLAAAEPSAKK